jgi:hypothetical protein
MSLSLKTWGKRLTYRKARQKTDNCQASDKTSRSIDEHILKRNRHVEYPSLELIVVQLVKTSHIHAEKDNPQDQTKRSDHEPG